MRLLDGDRGAIVWDDDPERVILKTAPTMPITQRGKEIRDIFAAIRPAAAQLAPLHRAGDRIAIHYSQASIRAQWMFDSRGDGKTWPRRLTSYELAHSRMIQIRNRYVKAVEDLGFTPEFVSYQQVESGELTRRKYRALLLPESVALSAAECGRIEEFVRAGGVALGDDNVGIMDEHCRRLPPGQRQAFYNSVDRRGPALLSQVFQTAGIVPPVKITGAREIKIWRFTGGSRSIIALLQNPATEAFQSAGCPRARASPAARSRARPREGLRCGARVGCGSLVLVACAARVGSARKDAKSTPVRLE